MVRKVMLCLLVLLGFILTGVVTGFAGVCSPSVPPNTLVFTAPSTNVDGTALTDLAGFKVYFSSTTGTESTGTVKDVGMDGVAVAGGSGTVALSSLSLVDGKLYFFEMTAYDTLGLQSGFSSEISCTYDATVPNPPGLLGMK